MYGGGLHTVNPMNAPIVDDSSYIIFNAHYEALDFKLPSDVHGKKWKVVFDTFSLNVNKEFAAGAKVKVGDRSVIVLQSELPLPRQRVEIVH